MTEKVTIEIDRLLTIQNAGMHYGKIMKAYKSSDIIKIDLKDVEDCDTAGLQLLYSLSKSCREKEKELIIKNPSGAVKDALNRICIPGKYFFK